MSSRRREPDDPLAVINAGLRDQEVDDDPNSPWLPLESNPEVFTDFAHKSGGLPKNWGWVDILGLDVELLNLVPEPCAGVILLFPCTDNIYEVRRKEKARLLQGKGSVASRKAYHVQQVAEFGNACGTIASVHALINGARIYSNTRGSALQQFRKDNANLSPQDRGRALLNTSALRSSSDQSANHQSAQTSTPDRYAEDLDHHFVAFSPISVGDDRDLSDQATHVVELDGTKVLPVDHGSVSSILRRAAADDNQANTTTTVQDPNKHKFLRAVAAVIQNNFMAVEPDSIEFTMMALCRVK